MGNTIGRENIDKSKLSRADRLDAIAGMGQTLYSSLNTILGSTKILDIADTLTDSQRNKLHEINAAGQNVLATINSIIDLSASVDDVNSDNSSTIPKNDSGIYKLYSNKNSSGNTAKPINIAIIIERVGTDPKIHQHLIESFLAEASVFNQELQVAINQGRTRKLKNQVNNLKLSAQNIGAKEIVTLCELLDLAEYSNSEQKSHKILRKLEAEFKAIQSYVENEYCANSISTY